MSALCIRRNATTAHHLRATEAKDSTQRLHLALSARSVIKLCQQLSSCAKPLRLEGLQATAGLVYSLQLCISTATSDCSARTSLRINSAGMIFNCDVRLLICDVLHANGWRATLAALSAVCKDWQEVAMPALYRTLDIDTFDWNKEYWNRQQVKTCALLRSFSRKRSLCAFVRTIQWTCDVRLLFRYRLGMTYAAFEASHPGRI